MNSILKFMFLVILGIFVAHLLDIIQEDSYKKGYANGYQSRIDYEHGR